MSKLITKLLMGLLFISVSSGLVLVLAYHPSHAFESVQSIEYLVPYGALFRKIHYFSSELSLCLLLIHIGVELFQQQSKMLVSSWTYSIIAFFILIVLMFSGFVLKADQSANAAMNVFFSLLNHTILVEKLSVLFQDSVVVYYKFFIWHVLLLPTFFLLALIKHTKTLYPKSQYVLFALGLSVFILLIVSMPSDIVFNQKVNVLKGPWFFWGAENLLQLGCSSSVVNAILIFPLFILLLYPHVSTKGILKIILTSWSIVYIGLSVIQL